MGNAARDVAPSEGQPLLATFSRNRQPVVSRRRFFQSILFFGLVIAASFAIMFRIFHGKWLLGSIGGHSGWNCQRERMVHHKSFPSVDFATGGSLAILEERRDHGDHGDHGHHISTSGSITFRRIPGDSADNATGFVTVELRATDKEILDSVDEHVEFDANPKVLTVSSPWHVDGLRSGVSHCLDIEITVYVPWDATFDHLKVETVRLGIKVFDDIAVHISDTASFKTVSGGIKFPGAEEAIALDEAVQPQPWQVNSDELRLSPRRGINGISTHIKSVSGGVAGKFSLYDLLSIDTTSGTISTILTPEYSADKAVSPAILKLSSRSGVIRTRLPFDSSAATTIPARDYQTTVTTVSGTIHGSYYIGSEANFKSTSGSLSLVLHGGTARDVRSLTTSTTSGTHRVQILTTAQDSTDRQTTEALDQLHSTHKSVSGSIHLIYPKQWEGKIDLQSLSGRLQAKGDGVKVVSETHGHPKTLHAIKSGQGASDSTISGHAISGSIEVWVGTKK